jgi:hypothetical protein
MFEQGNQLNQLVQTSISDDGNAVGVRFVRRDGMEFDLWLEIYQLTDLFYALGMLAKFAGERRGNEPPLPPLTQNETSPIPILGAGFQQGQSPDDIRLLVRLHGFDIAFQIPSSQLADFAAHIARTAATLSADHSKKN